MNIINWNLQQKKFYLKWWEKLLLMFVPKHYGVDWGYNNKKVVVVVKKMFGKIYIVDEQVFDDLTKP